MVLSLLNQSFFTIKGLGLLNFVVGFKVLMLAVIAKLVTLLVTPFLELVTPRRKLAQYFTPTLQKIDF